MEQMTADTSTDSPVASLRAYLQDLSRPVARSLGLSKLPEHVHAVAGFTLFFFATHLILAPVLSKAFFPRTYGSLRTSRTRNNWNIRVVSLVHALIILPLAFGVLYIPELDADRAFGWHPQYGTVASVACGYFIWDTIESLWHFSDVGFLIHGFSCLCIYLLSFKPFIAYYGPRFLLWELSTPFLNIHWFLDKMDLTGSTIQLVNGLLLLTSFAGARIVYGWTQSYAFYQTLFSIKNQIPLAVLFTYGFGNVILNGLNVLWLLKIVSAIQKRMVPPSTKKKEHMEHIGNGVADDNGDAKKLN